jgi:hypothetical protein
VAIVVVVVVGALGIAAIARSISRAAKRPRAGEIWFVNYPFREDFTKSKDRPALVVAVFERSALVRQITSQDKSRRPAEYEPLPINRAGLPKSSWVRKDTDNVALRHFRRRTGSIR